jgi:hypothetical protein
MPKQATSIVAIFQQQEEKNKIKCLLFVCWEALGAGLDAKENEPKEKNGWGEERKKKRRVNGCQLTWKVRPFLHNSLP